MENDQTVRGVRINFLTVLRNKKLLAAGIIGVLLLIGVPLIILSSGRKTPPDNTNAGIKLTQIMESECSWQPETDAQSYTYTVRNTMTGEVIQSGTAPKDTTKITFKSLYNNTYSCEAEAVKKCE